MSLIRIIIKWNSPLWRVLKSIWGTPWKLQHVYSQTSFLISVILQHRPYLLFWLPCAQPTKSLTESVVLPLPMVGMPMLMWISKLNCKAEEHSVYEGIQSNYHISLKLFSENSEIVSYFTWLTISKLALKSVFICTIVTNKNKKKTQRGS